MANEGPLTFSGSGAKALLVEDVSAKETRKVHSRTVNSQNQVLTAADVVALTGSIKSSNISVGTTATALPTTALSSRKVLVIKNSSTVTVFIGASDVSTTNGYPLAAESVSGKEDGGEIVLDVDDTIVVYGRVLSGTADVRILEIS